MVWSNANYYTLVDFYAEYEDIYKIQMCLSCAYITDVKKLGTLKDAPATCSLCGAVQTNPRCKEHFKKKKCTSKSKKKCAEIVYCM